MLFWVKTVAAVMVVVRAEVVIVTAVEETFCAEAAAAKMATRKESEERISMVVRFWIPGMLC
jgi:hypothetical protein